MFALYFWNWHDTLMQDKGNKAERLAIFCSLFHWLNDFLQCNILLLIILLHLDIYPWKMHLQILNIFCLTFGVQFIARRVIIFNHSDGWPLMRIAFIYFYFSLFYVKSQSIMLIFSLKVLFTLNDGNNTPKMMIYTTINTTTYIRHKNISYYFWKDIVQL